jgi:hypothetical protein
MIALGTVAIAASDGAKHVAAIEKGYRKLESLIKKKDTRGLMAFCSSDFSWTNPNGQVMHRKEFGEMMKGQMSAPGLKFHLVEMKNDSYGFMGDECNVRNTTIVKLSMKMNGQMMTMTGVSEGVDTWRRGPRGWRPAKVVIVKETQTPGG